MSAASPISAAYHSTNFAPAATGYGGSTTTAAASSMYSQHGGHHMFNGSSGGNSHGGHHANSYASSATSGGGGGHHGSTDSGLAPQSSFDTVPGSQHGMHASTPNSGSGQWGQGMHYSNSGSGAAQSGGYGNAYGASNYYGGGTQTPSMAGTGSGGGYSSYGMQQSASANAPASYASGGHNGSVNSASGLSSSASGLNGNAGAGSAHHSGSSTPTSQTPYHHQHPHSMSGGGAMIPSPQGYPTHHQQGGYYGGAHSSNSSNSVMSSPSYTSAPQYSTQLPLAGRHRVTTTLWEDEGTLCFQVDARGVCVARRHDNNMINGTKLLNVCGMSRGKRDGILKNEKERIVVKVGAMHLKGVWITFTRGKQLAEQNNILETLYPLFESNIQSFLYHPDNYPRTAAVMAAAQERQSQRSRASMGTDSPTTGYTRASSTSGNGSLVQVNPPPLMRSNTTPNSGFGAGAYGGHANGHSSAPSHSPSGHLGGPAGHSLHAQSHTFGGGGGGGGSAGLMAQRPSPVDRRTGTPYGEMNAFSGQRTYSGYRREMDELHGTEHNFAASTFDERI